MNKCQNCGAFVPVEKAFCPNCSEPMEAEEAPNRAHSFSSEMLATIRDDPEKYRQMLVTPPKKKAEDPAPVSAPPPAPLAAPHQPVSYSAPPSEPPPIPTRGEKSYLFVIVGIAVVLILVFIILYVLKVI